MPTNAPMPHTRYDIATIVDDRHSPLDDDDDDDDDNDDDDGDDDDEYMNSSEPYRYNAIMFTNRWVGST